MGGGKDESDKGLFSTIMQGYGGGHGYPYPSNHGYPPQGYPPLVAYPPQYGYSHSQPGCYSSHGHGGYPPSGYPAGGMSLILFPSVLVFVRVTNSIYFVASLCF
jgi:hypothetical protein